MRYYQALSTPGARRTCNDPRIQHFSGELLAVVYVTQLAAMHEIKATRRQMASRGLGQAQDRIFRLRWQHIYEEIVKLSCDEVEPHRKRVLVDIRTLLKHKHLTPFVGFRNPPSSLTTETLRKRPIFFRSRERRN
jgi:hypothetical protein